MIVLVSEDLRMDLVSEGEVAFRRWERVVLKMDPAEQVPGVPVALGNVDTQPKVDREIDDVLS